MKHTHRTIAILLGLVAAINSTAYAQSELSRYYVAIEVVNKIPGITSSRPIEELIPYVRLTGNGVPPRYYLDARDPQQYAVYALVNWGNSAPSAETYGGLLVGPYREDVCGGWLRAREIPAPSSTLMMNNNPWQYLAEDRYDYSNAQTGGGCPTFNDFPLFRSLQTTDEITFGAPVRRTAIDGGQYDASPMVLKRNGLPWYTHYFGYHMGLVANESNWDNANLSAAGALVNFFTLPSPANNFNLSKLPPPWVEDDVVEYVNRADFPEQPNGQYFYAVLATDKTLLDSLPVWQRSGKSFKSGGYVSACRFYGGKNGGPNTHFYSADDKECAALKAIPQLSYEGQTFAVNVPLPGTNSDGTKLCPIDSKPLYRVYNNASVSNGRFVSNHRYLTERADVAAVVAQGWVDEGQVMCVPL